MNGEFQPYPCQAIKLGRCTSNVSDAYLPELRGWLCDETSMATEVQYIYDVIEDVALRTELGHYLITYHT